MAAFTVAVGALAMSASTAASAAPAKPYEPAINPDDFGGPVDNPYFPLKPGTRWVYEGDTPDGHERIVVDVTGETKTILGVPALVIRDTSTIDGVIAEDTFDWYAQDREGNVWYFGEDTHEYKDGKVIGSKGSWEAGVDGAQPGIIMQARPKTGTTYRQEFSRGEAEDQATVLSRHASVKVPTGKYDDALKTKDFSTLEPSIVEHKFYARGVGVVLEVTVRGGRERSQLVEVTTATP
jgi:hypothetical protein